MFPFLTKFFIFDKKFYFCQRFLFLTTISIFAKDFYFRQYFLCLTKISPFLIKTAIFVKNSISFDLKIYLSQSLENFGFFGSLRVLA